MYGIYSSWNDAAPLILTMLPWRNHPNCSIHMFLICSSDGWEFLSYLSGIREIKVSTIVRSIFTAISPLWGTWDAHRHLCSYTVIGTDLCRHLLPSGVNPLRPSKHAVGLEAPLHPPEGKIQLRCSDMHAYRVISLSKNIRWISHRIVNPNPKVRLKDISLVLKVNLLDFVTHSCNSRVSNDTHFLHENILSQRRTSFFCHREKHTLKYKRSDVLKC